MSKSIYHGIVTVVLGPGGQAQRSVKCLETISLFWCYVNKIEWN